MDDPTVGPSAPMKLQRACECNRLEKQFLITAYERLAPIIERDDPRANANAKRDAPEYRALFGLGNLGALALYQHEHDHDHLEGHDHHGHSHAEKSHA